MARTSHTHLHLVPAPPPRVRAGDVVGHTLADVINVLCAVRHRQYRASYRADDTTRLYFAAEQLLVIAAKRRGKDFYARSAE